MKMWEIRENEEYRHPMNKRIGYESGDHSEYECGFEDGYREAMRKFTSYEDKRMMR